VSARERAVATHAGRLAAREERLTARERDLDARAAKVEESERELAAAEVPPSPPSGQSALEPASVLGGAWNLDELQRLVDAHTGASPEQIDEWRMYLFFLREHALPDQTLPAGFDRLIDNVFADLAPPRGHPDA
jgi:hypothetical protein